MAACQSTPNTDFHVLCAATPCGLLGAFVFEYPALSTPVLKSPHKKSWVYKEGDNPSAWYVYGAGLQVAGDGLTTSIAPVCGVW